MRLLKIGRDVTCDIVLHSEKASSLHAELTLLNSGDIMLEDKGSRNGTFIMNQPIRPNKPVSVRRGDAIRFADEELQWSQVPMPEDNSAYQGVYGIGSHFNNDFQISGPTVSRYHATVKHGRDGKMYIVDHSKNGTTVDGVKIPSNTPYRIKKKSAILCGGVPVNLGRLPWGSSKLKYVAALLLLLVVVGGGVYFFLNRAVTLDATQIYDRYNTSVVMIRGVYHYEVSAGDLDLEKIGLPTKIVLDKTSGEPIDLSESPEAIYVHGIYYGTGFFVSDDGKIITNLHIVKPWLNPSMIQNAKKAEELYRRSLAKLAEQTSALTLLGIDPIGLSAYISQLKVTGVLDGVLFVPQGRFWSNENAITCTVLSAGEDINKDVALIQSDKMELPNKKATFVNVKDSMEVSDEALKVGNPMFTIGFPYSVTLQEVEGEKGLQVFCHAGHITRESNEYKYLFDAVSAGGASGSPIFNDRGMLIGVIDAGVDKENINEGVKAKYIKELIENPHQK